MPMYGIQRSKILVFIGDYERNNIMRLKNHTMLVVFLTAILALLSAGASAANGMSDAEAQKALEKTR